MTAVRNQKSSEIKKRNDTIRRQQTAAPLRRSSLTQEGDQLRVGPEGTGGTLKSDGTMDWAGIVNFIGQFFQTGPSVFDGPVSITLTLDVEGNTTISGSLDVTAETQLRALTKVLADLSVESGGKIKIGTFELRPASSGGAEIVSPVDIKVTTPLLDLAGAFKVAQGIVAPNLPPRIGTGLTPGLLMMDPTTGVIYRVLS